MTDDIFQKQLESLGVDSTRITSGDAERAQQEQLRRAMLSVVKIIMDSMDGRRWFYSKLEMCRVFTTPFVAGKQDVTSFLSGLQAVGQNMLRDIMEASPEKFFLMTQEAAARNMPKKPEPAVPV